MKLFINTHLHILTDQGLLNIIIKTILLLDFSQDDSDKEKKVSPQPTEEDQNKQNNISEHNTKVKKERSGSEVSFCFITSYLNKFKARIAK